MKKFLKFGAFITITGVLFFVVCTVAFYYLVRVGEFRSFLIDEIEKNSALKVGLGAADLEIGWVTGVGFRDVAIAMPESAVPEIAAERITARVALLPLLQRKIIFYEIRLQRPTVALIGDADGRLPLLDKLLKLPLLKRDDSEFSLDLQSIKIRSGAVDYVDRRSTDSRGEWRLRNADVDIERVRGQKLREFMKDLIARPAEDDAGAALHFALKGQIDRDNVPMQLKASGRLVFPQDALLFDPMGACLCSTSCSNYRFSSATIRSLVWICNRSKFAAVRSIMSIDVRPTAAVSGACATPTLILSECAARSCVNS